MQAVGRASGRRSRLTIASLVLWCVAVLAASVLLLPGTAPAQVVLVAPGDVVVSQMAAGRVVAIAPDGQIREIATGLASPRGVAVMADGSILVAELGENRIVGIGGRFGTGTPQEVVSIPFPEGLTVSPSGEVFATALQSGEMGRIDLDAGTFTPIARGLDGPGDVAVRGLAMFVTESAPGGRVVSSVTADGRTAEFASGFAQPIGLAFGPGNTLFVADFGEGRIVRVDAQGATTTFAELALPTHLAIEPWAAVEGEPFTVVATSDEGVVRFDATGARIGQVDLEGTAGIATVPGTGPNGTPGPTVATTALTPSTTAVTPTSEAAPTESAPATTRPPRTTTSLSEAEGAPSSTSGGILLASVAIIALIVVGAVVFAVVQRSKSGDRSGFEERPLDANTVALAFGTCAAEEVEVAEAEGALASLEVQSEAAVKRLGTAIAEVSDAKAALAEARRASGSATAASGAPSVVVTAPPEPEPELASPSGLRLDDLELHTAAGRAALDAFLKREIEADELEEMWRALGEDRAIEVVRAARPAAPEPPSGTPGRADGDPATVDGAPDAVRSPSPAEPDDLWAEPAPDEPAVDLDPETLAANVLAEAEADVTYAHAEIERLHERQAAARARIATAQRALEDCQARHRAELEEKSAAIAEAATVAAASALYTDPTESADPSRDDAARPGGTDEAGGRPGPFGAVSLTAPVLPSIPERPPLTPDAQTVASLRRPTASPVPDPAGGAGAGPNADTSGGDDVASSPVTAVRRTGLDRGLFGDDQDLGSGGAKGTFPTTPTAGAADVATNEGPVVPPVDADQAPAPADPSAGEPAATTSPDGVAAADEPAPASSGSATARRERALSDGFFRESVDPEPVADPAGGRIDDLVFAWQAGGFQKLPDDQVVEGSAPAPAETEPAEAVSPTQPAPEPPVEGDDPPRPDLKFL